jgi:preprotein translocase subunit SecB
MKQSSFQLIRYLVPQVSCAANPKYDQNKPIEGGFELFAVNVVLSRQTAPIDNFPGSPWSIEMSITQEIREGINFPYKFNITVLGFFTCLQPFQSPLQEEGFVKTNGSSMLYGIAREIIRSLTASGPWFGLLLPTLSFAEKENTPATPGTVGS